MPYSLLFVTFLLLLSSCNTTPGTSALVSTEPSPVLRQSPENPRYLEYKGEALVLITSAEHYGAVLNMDFDYKTYLQTLADEGLNYTRIFTGTYLEPVNNVFGIQRNTLAPAEGSFLAPFVVRDGGYDLSQYDPAWFGRLKSFISLADELGIIVEMTLFSSIYSETAWTLMPFHPSNNVNGTSLEDYHRVHTLYNGELLPFQEAFVREVVRELNDFGNIFFEIQNEPWSDNQNLAAFVHEDDSLVYKHHWQQKVELANQLSMDWQARMVEVIRETEAGLANTHLIAQNICNFQFDVDPVPEGVSIINFHYADPEAFLDNLGKDVVIGLDETGFMDKYDSLFIYQAWRSICSGGGLYNNLDYSFTVGHEKGDWEIAASNPGWGSPEFRSKLARLSKWVHGLPFTEMEVRTDLFKACCSDMEHYALLAKDGTCLAFVEGHGGRKLKLDIPACSYELSLTDPNGSRIRVEEIEVEDGLEILPPFGGKAFAFMLRPIK